MSLTTNKISKIFAVVTLFALIVMCSMCLTACVDDELADDNSANSDKNDKEIMNSPVYLKIGDTTLTAELEDNAATRALMSKLPVTVDLRDYGGWEKVGDLGFSLPTSNEQITAKPCDFVLYQGNQLVIFYGSNSWSYTRLGRIQNLNASQLREILGSGNVTVTLTTDAA